MNILYNIFVVIDANYNWRAFIILKYGIRIDRRGNYKCLLWPQRYNIMTMKIIIIMVMIYYYPVIIVVFFECIVIICIVLLLQLDNTRNASGLGFTFFSFSKVRFLYNIQSRRPNAASNAVLLNLCIVGICD